MFLFCELLVLVSVFVELVAKCFVLCLLLRFLFLDFILYFYFFGWFLVFSNTISSLLGIFSLDLNLFSGHRFRTEIVIHLIFILFLLIFLNTILLISLFHAFLRWLLLCFNTRRQTLTNIVLNFVQYIWARLDTVFMVIHVVFLGLTNPTVLAYHVKVDFGRFLEPLIFLEWMFIEAIWGPGEEIEHTGIFFSIFGWFSKSLLGKIDFVMIILWDCFARKWLHF